MEIAHFNYPSSQPPLFLKEVRAAVVCASDPTHSNAHLRQRLIATVKSHWSSHRLLGADIRRKLEEGNPVIVHGFPLYDTQLRHGLYLALCLTIDRLMTHDGKIVIWPITPKSSKSDFGTYSENDLEAPLHTDGMYKHRPPRYVGMLAVKQAESGGKTVLASALDVYGELEKTAKGRKALSILRRVYPVRIPSAYADSETPQFIHRAPLVMSSSSLVMRFREDVLADGLRSCVVADHDQKTEALASVAECFRQEEMSDSFLLPAGELLFLNNQNLLHGRRRFEDPTRLLERVWFK